MDWKRFLIQFLRNVVIGMVLGGLLLGAFGYFLAGKEGFINMATWGIILGLMGSFSGGLFMLFAAQIGTGYAGRYGKWWFKNESEGEEQKPK